MNSKRKCKSCGDYVRVYVITPKGVFCNIDSAVKYSYANKSKGADIQRKEQKKKDTVRKKELLTRSQWYNLLKTQIHRWVVHVRDKDKGCYTCGKTDPSVKYDCGHRHHAGRGGGDRRRFIEENLHKQCSVNCNQYGSGMPVEYDKALDVEYGKGFAANLACVANYPTLKELFPTHNDIELEIIRYKKLIKGC
ncbi:MAG: putative protein ninG [Prokaryotic dsDNA virus sp.]|nr:MAG: putative protein ninG [Prokaryotic dsDNA virus sp.]|tara:strand:- start:32201 stop:32779 length:579 start_codon:yes stop_codon:yes gene_type:complete